jgi:hypothetical protein
MLTYVDSRIVTSNYFWREPQIEQPEGAMFSLHSALRLFMGPEIYSCFLARIALLVSWVDG